MCSIFTETSPPPEGTPVALPIDPYNIKAETLTMLNELEQLKNPVLRPIVDSSYLSLIIDVIYCDRPICRRQAIDNLCFAKRFYSDDKYLIGKAFMLLQTFEYFLQNNNPRNILPYYNCYQFLVKNAKCDKTKEQITSLFKNITEKINLDIANIDRTISFRRSLFASKLPTVINNKIYRYLLSAKEKDHMRTIFSERRTQANPDNAAEALSISVAGTTI